jgi:branched-chain amino acid transport system substrate-binding protein
MIAVQKPDNQETIKIGFIAPLTGDAASYGQGERDSLKLAVEEINSKGGINNKKLEIIFEDGKCNGKDAVTAAQKLINIDKVKIIFGGGCSGETLAVAPITEENKVLLFSAFSSSPQVTNAGDFVFRNSPSDTDGGKDAAKMVFLDGKRKVAILTENTEYAQALKKVFKEQFISLGGTIVADEIYNQDAKDYRTQLTKIKETNPDAVFFNAQSGISAGLSAKQAKELAIAAQYYGHIAFSSDDALNSGGNALNGLKFTDAPGLNKDNPKAVSFLKKFLSKYPNPQSDYDIGARYDSVYIIKNAIEYCRDVNTECTKDYLYSMPQYCGVIGCYNFDKNGDVTGITYAVKKIIDAEKKEITEQKIE